MLLLHVENLDAIVFVFSGRTFCRKVRNREFPYFYSKKRVQKSKKKEGPYSFWGTIHTNHKKEAV